LLVNAGDLTGDGVPEFAGDAPGDNVGEVTGYMVDGQSLSSGLDWSDSSVEIGIPTAFSLNRDFNADGYVDIFFDPGWVSYGPFALDAWEWDFGVHEDGVRFGFSNGDLTGDGADDLLWVADEGDHERWYLTPGPLVATTSIRDDAVASISFSPGKHDHAIMNMKDLDGDGVQDLVVGMSEDYFPMGTLYVFSGPPVGDHDVFDADVSWPLPTDTYPMELVDDLNGDGIPEVALIRRCDDTNAVQLFSGNSASGPATDFTFTTLFAPYGAMQVAEAPDINTEGGNGLLVGSLPFCDYDGRVYVVEEPGEGAKDVEEVSTVIFGNGVIVDPLAEANSMGDFDYDMDGISDMAIVGVGGIAFFSGASL